MENNKIKIIFIIHTLTAGGAQRVMSYLAQNLSKEKFDVTFVSIGYKKDNVYDLNSINQVYFNQKRVIYSVIPIAKYLRLNKPDIVFSSIIHVNTLMAYISIFFPRIKFMLRVANVLSVLKNYSNQSKIYFPKIKRF